MLLISGLQILDFWSRLEPSIPGSMQMSQLARGGNSGLGELETDPAPKGGKAATASCYAYIHINVSLSILISRNSVAR
jgi:hypothetical protein